MAAISPQKFRHSFQAELAKRVPKTSRIPRWVIDAVDLTLCNNPQTREVWAAARAQAALVGLAQSAWFA